MFERRTRDAELDPLLVLLDFLVGDSVEVLARKNRLPNEHVEQALRTALSSYGFHAARERGSVLSSAKGRTRARA